MPQKTGVMGGTFNPVHIGHLRAAEEAIEMLDLDTFLFIPAAVPPHKSDPEIQDFEHRWEMLRLATQGNPRFQLSDLERKLPGKSYTVKTLTKLQEVFSEETDLYFLLGLDAFLELDTWWRYKELFRLAHMVIVRRPGYREKDLVPFLNEKISSDYRWDDVCGCFQHPELRSVYYLQITPLDISSSQIRHLRAKKRSIRYLVPDEVMRYIEKADLYHAEGAGRIPVNKQKSEAYEETKSIVNVTVEINKSMDARKKAILCIQEIAEHKGREPVLLDVSSLSSFADYFIICAGKSGRQVQGIADRVEESLRKQGIRPLGVEGRGEGQWVLMDYGDVIIHIFYEPVRSFYDLESLWSDAQKVVWETELARPNSHSF